MRKHYTATFKAQVVQELLKEDKTIAQIAAESEQGSDSYVPRSIFSKRETG